MSDPVLVRSARVVGRPRLVEAYLRRVGRRPHAVPRDEFHDLTRDLVWQVADDRWFLARVADRAAADIPELRDAAGPDGRVPADWVSGLLVMAGAAVAVWNGRAVYREREGWPIEPGWQLRTVFPPEELAFIRAIRASPKDRTTRLVYADWLDENGGGVRGALVRLEDAMRAAPTSGPLGEKLVGHRGSLVGQVDNWVWLRLMGYELSRNRAADVWL